jgi:arabinose-5-phosphate isomerase
MTTVAAPDGRLAGIISDGDLRRLMERHGDRVLERTAGECMTHDPVTIGPQELATRALDLMEERRITSLLVTGGDGRVTGVVHLHDLWKTEMV